MAWYEYNQIKLNPFTTCVCFGGVVFGAYILLNTFMRKNSISKPVMFGKLLFGVSLLTINLFTISSNVKANRERAERGFKRDQDKEAIGTPTQASE